MAILVLFVALPGALLLATGLPTYFFSSPRDRLTLPMSAGAMAAYAAGALFVWSLVPPSWPLSFWSTLRADVDTGRYGHPIEHAAEGIVLWQMFAGFFGGIAGGLLAASASRRRGRG